MYKKGILTVKPICAKLTYDTETFGSMDAYCKVQVGDQIQKTSVAHNTGKSPSWEDKLTFTTSNENDQVHISVFDKDTFSSDDYIADAWIPLVDAHMTGDSDEWFSLHHKGKDAGKIMVCIDFVPH